jgi:hypothetical protein
MLTLLLLLLQNVLLQRLLLLGQALAQVLPPLLLPAAPASPLQEPTAPAAVAVRQGTPIQLQYGQQPPAASPLLLLHLLC